MRFVPLCALALPIGLALRAAQGAPLLAPSPGGPVFTGPTSAHVSAIFWNPAASGLMSGHHVLVLGTASLDVTSIQRRAISTSDGEPGGDHTFPSESPLYVTPGAILGFTSDLGTDDFTLGLAGILAFSDRVPELPESLGYHSLGGALYGTTTIISVGYRATSRVYFGIGASFLFSKVDLGFLRDTVLDSCAAPPCGVEDPAKAERWDVASDWSAIPGQSFSPVFSVNAGTLFRVYGWWFGLGVVFPAGITGTVTKTADVKVTPAGGAAAVEGTARVTYHVPWFIHLGARRTVLGSLELLINTSFARMSLMQDIDIRLLGRAARDAGLPEWVVRHRGLNDVFSVEAGLEQQPARRIRLGARVRFASNAVPGDDVSPELLDGPTLTLAGGLELRATRRLAVVLGYAAGLQLPIDVAGGAYSPRAAIDCNASGHDLDTAACTAVREGRGIPTAAGSYKRLANQVSLGLTFDIW